MPKDDVSHKLISIYEALQKAFGKRHKWFGDTRDVIIIGAVLTQNTNWLNVEKALENLKWAGLITLEGLADADPNSLASLIKPTGYYNQKALRLIELSRELTQASLPKDPYARRSYYLSLKGLGPETADCILLYADLLPFFVIDAYTIRIFSRLGFCSEKAKYSHLQGWFMQNLPQNLHLYQEFHALIVQLAKVACKKQKPDCANCPLRDICPH